MNEKSRGLYETRVSGPLMSVAKYSLTVDADVKTQLVNI
jgi:hypothetical protein